MLSSNAYDLFLTLIDFHKLLVIHGLENCFATRNCFHGCMLVHQYVEFVVKGRECIVCVSRLV